jgi:hypothetical protein
MFCWGHSVEGRPRGRGPEPGEKTMGLILLIILILLLIGAMPVYPYSRRWGYGPTGLIGVLLVILLVLMFANIVPAPWTTVP